MRLPHRPVLAALPALLLGGALVPLAAAPSATAANAATAPPSPTIAVDVPFTAGSTVTSANGIYQLTLQNDGNLVEYGGGRALWNAGTRGSGASYLRVQGDGNVVLYTAAGRPVWYSASFATGITGLTVGDDGSLVVATGAGAEVWGVHPHPETLPAGGALTPGQSLWSADGDYRLSVQTDGNVVVYSVTNVPVWWTNTTGSMSALVMQGDGNLVLYRTSGAPAWYSGTRGTNQAGVTIGPDGVATVAAGTAVAWRSGQVAGRLWRGNTLASGGALVAGATTLIMQGDGNLVSYPTAGGGPLWWTNTFVPGTRAVMQGDGNLVLYPPSGPAVWSSGTWGTDATYLSVSTGGNLAFLGSASRAPVWVQGPPNWTALARCESGGNPKAVGPGGYYGLYQFDLSTWASNGGTGNPADASPAVQTAVASTLYLARGRAPWPTCGRYL